MPRAAGGAAGRATAAKCHAGCRRQGRSVSDDPPALLGQLELGLGLVVLQPAIASDILVLEPAVGLGFDRLCAAANEQSEQRAEFFDIFDVVNVAQRLRLDWELALVVRKLSAITNAGL
jgi:hypothetical protein